MREFTIRQLLAGMTGIALFCGAGVIVQSRSETAFWLAMVGMPCICFAMLNRVVEPSIGLLSGACFGCFICALIFYFDVHLLAAWNLLWPIPLFAMLPGGMAAARRRLLGFWFALGYAPTVLGSLLICLTVYFSCISPPRAAAGPVAYEGRGLVVGLIVFALLPMTVLCCLSWLFSTVTVACFRRLARRITSRHDIE